jgi:pyruvate formate lyase activating enzyme
MTSTTGIVFDIKKFSLHDGPGIRTTVFLKGCPLHCSWCHNPEGISPLPEIHFWDNRCLNCHECVQVCTPQALTNIDGVRAYDSTLCQGCGFCADACPTEATEIVGTEMHVMEVIKEIEKDLLYYDQSGGGATFSGGEPLLQIDFLSELLAACKDRGIHTVVDTSGFVPFENLQQVLHNVDLFLYDVKIIDENKHIHFTGVPNGIILDNLVRLVQKGARIIPRVPIIPGVNDHYEDIRQSCDFLISAGGFQEVNLLPYHQTAASKYARMGMDFIFKGINPPTEERMDTIALEYEKLGFSVIIGG